MAWLHLKDWTHNQFWRCQSYPACHDPISLQYQATQNKNAFLRNCLASQRDNNQRGLRAQIIQCLASSAPIDDNMLFLAPQECSHWSHPCRIYGIHRYLPQLLSITWHSNEMCHFFSNNQPHAKRLTVKQHINVISLISPAMQAQTWSCHSNQ